MQTNRLLIFILMLTLCRVICGDSGIVRISEVDGPWRLTVFTEPTPLREGLVDFSVLIQTESDDAPILDATVSLALEHVDGESDSILVEATREAATNQLLYSAKFELPASGLWEIETAALQDEQISRVRFQFEAAEKLPPILDMWFWFILPVIAIGLITINQWLQRRSPKR